ncbi:MAG: RNA polymerase sigma factor [Thiotrichaceae bacterium]
MNTDHTKLLKQSANKNQQAFKQLYDETSPILYSLALRMLDKTHLAEECLQEAYLKIWQKAGSFDAKKSSTLTWMYTITKNTALDKLRALKSRPQQTVVDEYDLSTLSSSSLMPDTVMALGNEMKQRFESLKDMKPLQRECLILSCYYGHTHQELSHKLGVPLGTVKAWIRRGKQQLLAA